jgi:cell division cycle 2-like
MDAAREAILQAARALASSGAAGGATAAHTRSEEAGVARSEAHPSSSSSNNNVSAEDALRRQRRRAESVGEEADAGEARNPARRRWGEEEGGGGGPGGASASSSSSSAAVPRGSPPLHHSSSSTTAAPARVPSWMSHNALLKGCRSVGCYRPIHAIDEGTYGKVWLAEDRETGERVALKQIKFDQIHANEGFPVTALREVNALLELRHPNIVRVREMVIGSSLDKVYMVMDFLPHNLRDFLELLPAGTFLTQAEVKCLLLQLLRGLAHMHARWFLHRDLKTHNLLIDSDGTLALCDFGLARRFGSPPRPYTETVVTLWYRAPEVLLGVRAYGPALDVWSAGCIFAEFLTKQPLFQTRSEAETIQHIFRLLGTPTDAAWPGWRDLPLAKELRAHERNHPPVPLRKALKLSSTSFGGGGSAFVSDTGLDLLARMLTCDPEQRITAAEALAHPWFEESPPPADPRLLPAFPSAHDRAGGGGRGGGEEGRRGTTGGGGGAGGAPPAVAPPRRLHTPEEAKGHAGGAAEAGLADE